MVGYSEGLIVNGSIRYGEGLVVKVCDNNCYPRTNTYNLSAGQ